jgi:amino acid adenylation domain-containing protein
MSAALRARLRSVAERCPDRPALWVRGESYTYGELFHRAAGLAEVVAGRPEPYCLVYTGKNLTRYVAMLASVLAGKAFVPVCPTSPRSTCERILDRFAGQAVVVCDSDDPAADAAFAALVADPARVLASGPAAAEPPDGPRWTGEPAAPGDGAYVMFTSGSTGVPKAVLVTLDNLTAYLDGATELFRPTCEDRFAQVNNATFDLSVHDIFLPWSVGACVYALPDEPYHYPALVREHELTFWLSVPTTGLTMADLGLLTPGSLPSLRNSLFCGEPLPRRLASTWRIAAPNGRLVNVYGPTECTIAVTAFDWRPDDDFPDVVPIGWAYPGQRLLVVGDDLHEVPHGRTGELCLQGSQLVPGYLDDPEQTARRFVRLPGQSGVWYRTGDWVSRDEQHGMLFHGRRDDQLQVRGIRVERLEVESLLKQALGTDSVAVVGWPVVEGSLVRGLVAFVADIGLGKAEIRRRIGGQLPAHLLPSHVHIGPLPQNASRKVDYPALKRRLEAGL